MAKEDELFLSLKSGDSIFKFIPDDIGEILYCDTNNSNAVPDSIGKRRLKILLSILIPAVLIVLCWTVFKGLQIFITILLVIISAFCLWRCFSFKGTDYFVGSKGAAEIKFSGTRENIINKNVLYFCDFDDMVTSETVKYRNYIYYETEYKFVIYGHIKDGIRPVVAEIQSFYNQEKPNDYYTDQLYRFWKKIETYWSQYRLIQMKEEFSNDEEIGFNVYTEKGFYNNYFVFKGEKLSIHGKTYDKSNVKNIYFKNGNLVLEDVNYSSKLLGLLKKGDKETIPLSYIGNRELFLLFFQYFASTLS